MLLTTIPNPALFSQRKCFRIPFIACQPSSKRVRILFIIKFWVRKIVSSLGTIPIICWNKKTIKLNFKNYNYWLYALNWEHLTMNEIEKKKDHKTVNHLAQLMLPLISAVITYCSAGPSSKMSKQCIAAHVYPLQMS